MEGVMSDSDFDFSEYFNEADAYAAGDVQFEFVDSPSLIGDNVEFTFRTVGGRTAPAGSVVSSIAVVTSDQRIIGGGKTTVRSELGGHDVGGSRINPAQYTREDGEYYLAITVGGDTRNVSYRIEGQRVHAP
jgi:hypothetical protein